MKEEKTEAAEFRQQVRMAAVQVAGLRPEELAQALAYEVEPMSGIPAPEAEVAYQPVVDADPTVRVYDVVVRRRTRRRGTSGGAERWLRPLSALAALVILAVAADGVWIAWRRSTLERTVNERRPLQTELDRLRSETSAVRAAAEAIRARREAAVRAQDAAAARRQAPADLLGELAAACGEHAVLTSIIPGEKARSLTLKGMGVTAEAVTDVLSRLTVRLAQKGWRLKPGAFASSGTGATVTFWFEVTRDGE